MKEYEIPVPDELATCIALIIGAKIRHQLMNTASSLYYLKLSGTEKELEAAVKALLVKGFNFTGCEVSENPHPDTTPLTCILFDLQLPSVINIESR